MALAAIESEKISENTASERFGVPQQTLNDRRRKEVHATGAGSMQVPRETHYSDGRVVREVTDQERDEWAASHAEGKSFKSIAKEFGRDPRTVTAEIRKRQLPVPAPAQEESCPEALQRGQPVAPKTEPTVASAPAPINTPTGLLPELSVKLIAEEKKLATKRAAALVGLADIADQLLRMRKVAQNHWEKNGRSVLREFKKLADEQLAGVVLSEQCQALGLPADATYEQLLWKVDSVAKAVSEEARSLLYLYGYTEFKEN